MQKAFVRAFACGASLAALAASASAQSAGTFDLGRIETVTVTAGSTAAPEMSAATVSNETMFDFHKVSVDKALDLVPGAASSNSGGSRNEQLIFVRGFDRFETPLSIDGIRVYLPADNRLDFGRFLTADLSQVQVAKGYVSVLNGPGALGGAINLVTRKPTQDFEVDARSGLLLGSSGSLDEATASLSLGTKQDNYYLQGSTAWSEQSRFELPATFQPTATENGGFRDHSRARDWSLHLKAGYTPNDTDEYSISYLKQTAARTRLSLSPTLSAPSATGAGPIGTFPASISSPARR